MMTKKIYTGRILADIVSEEGDFRRYAEITKFTGRIKYQGERVEFEVAYPYKSYKFGAGFFGFLLWIIKLNPSTIEEKTEFLSEGDIWEEYHNEEIIIHCAGKIT